MKVTNTFKHKKVQGFKFGSSFFGKPKMFVHTYFVDGLLIDTGHSNMEVEIMKTLTKLPVNQVFITHHHEDHTGNLAPLQRYFQCPTYASSLCVEMMKNPPKISPAQWMTWGDRPANFELKVKEEYIETPNHTFQIIPIPGHAKDMVALWEKEEGWLFSADLWVYDYIRYFMRAESVGEQIESLKLVLSLDFEVLFCSHNPQFENVKPRLRNKLQFFEDFYGNVADLHHKGHSISAIHKALNIKESWQIRIASLGELSTLNMVKAVIRDEAKLVENSP